MKRSSSMMKGAASGFPAPRKTNSRSCRRSGSAVDRGYCSRVLIGSAPLAGSEFEIAKHMALPPSLRSTSRFHLREYAQSFDVHLTRKQPLGRLALRVKLPAGGGYDPARLN